MCSNYFRHLFVLSSVFIFKCVFAQLPGVNQRFNLNQFSTEDGLSQSNVYQIIDDSDGFVWILTDDGLNRFDGYKFSVYKYDPDDSTSISDNKMNCMVEDSNQNLWVGTSQGGFCRYDKNNNNFKCFKYDSQDSTSLSQNTVTGIIESSDGNLWIGTNWGLNIFNPANETNRRIMADSSIVNCLLDNRVYSVLETPNHEVWVGSATGISIFDLSGKCLRRIKGGGRLGLVEGQVRNMIAEKDGTVWVSVESKGLLKYEPANDQFIFYGVKPNAKGSLGRAYIRSLFIDTQDNLWIGMDGFGFQFLDRETGLFHTILDNSNLDTDVIEKLYEIHEDKDGNLWLGSYGYGFFVLNVNSKNFAHYTKNEFDPLGLSHSSILSVAENNKGKVWLGTDGGGLNLFNPEANGFEFLTEKQRYIGGTVIKSLAIGANEVLWVGAFNDGLTRVQADFKDIECYHEGNSGLESSNIWSLLVDKKERLWIGTLGGGLHLWNEDTKSIRKISTAYDEDPSITALNVVCLMEDAEGNIWLGTGGHGVLRYNPESGESKRFLSGLEDPYKLSHREIRSLYQSENGSIWIGTTLGLNKYDPQTKKIEKIYKSDGLPSDVIKGIVENEGILWLSSSDGVFSFDPSTKEIVKYNGSDGLQGREFNYNVTTKISTGEILMGGVNGLNTFFPDKIRNNTKEPKILFTNFLLFNRPVDIDPNGLLKKEINQVKKLEFAYDQYIFTIEFAADEQNFPKENHYQYKLDGFDPDWSEVGDVRAATYTNLPAGEYKFLVRATNNAGVWSNKVRTLDITVHPPWWRTKTAYAIFLAFGILMILAIVRLRTSYLLAQKVRLRRLVSKRTKQLEEKNERITMQAEELNTFNDTLNALNENLEKTVIERTNELVVKNKKLSDYAFLNAHNLRAPVANIKGLIQLMNLDLTPEEKEDYIQKIKEQVEDVDAVLYDINQKLKKDTLIDEEEIKDILDQSINSSSSSDTSS
ncbi:ligand-binding sensor domain-containing protein [Reichenbachiella sp.]|uniref:ligand-binding sensor domain-containing protein n=1 Tax=Reichenbachiella sp. TaxID=2184521 RepID=UPI003BAEF6C5